MVTVKEIVKAIEAFAPLEIQDGFDNSGLVYGRKSAEIETLLISLDLTEAVVREAVSVGAKMIVCHHPPIFTPLRRFDETEPVHRALASAIRNGIAVYAAHTTIDYAEGGLNDTVAELLGLIEIGTLNGSPSDARIGRLKVPTTLSRYAAFVAETLDDPVVRFIGDPDRRVLSAAVVNGAGGGDTETVKSAMQNGADVFLTAEVKYRVARFTKDNNYAIISFGHYDSERCFPDLMERILSGISGLEIVKSGCDSDPYTR